MKATGPARFVAQSDGFSTNNTLSGLSFEAQDALCNDQEQMQEPVKAVADSNGVQSPGGAMPGKTRHYAVVPVCHEPRLSIAVGIPAVPAPVLARAVQEPVVAPAIQEPVVASSSPSPLDEGIVWELSLLDPPSVQRKNQAQSNENESTASTIPSIMLIYQLTPLITVTLGSTEGQSNDIANLSRDFMAFMVFNILRTPVYKGWRRARRRQQSFQHGTSQEHRFLSPVGSDITVTGIKNCGQTCFLNSVLQALASLDPFLAYLGRVVDLYTQQLEYDPTPSCYRVCLSERLGNLLQSLNHESVPKMDARDILRRVGERHEQFRSRGWAGVGKEQQDAQELLQALLETVINDAQLDSCDSLQSSYLSTLDDEEPANIRETLSFSALLMKMDSEQSISDMSCLDFHDSYNAADMQGHGDSDNCANGGHANGHANQNDEITRQVDKLRDDAINMRREEKKQEDCETALVKGYNDARTVIDSVQASRPSNSFGFTNEKPPHVAAGTQLSSSIQLMLQTLSPITPSPLSGWFGSTLQCCSCKHVRPIQNAPFLDIPIVPTAVSNYMSWGNRGVTQALSATYPSCTLSQCLAEFTKVEIVNDVECRNCTIQQELAQLDEEIWMLRGAIETVSASSRNKGSKSTGCVHVEGLEHELARAEARIYLLRNIDPDDADDDLTAPIDSSVNSLYDDIGSTEPLQALKRGYAQKRLLITRLPTILCLHVQRRYCDPKTKRMAKAMQHVDFPETLDLSNFCAYGGDMEGMPSCAGSTSSSTAANDKLSRVPSSIPYKLMSVIEHRGNAFAGHYITYRRVGSGQSNDWFMISDQIVKPMRWRDVRTCQAYMLFYEMM